MKKFFCFFFVVAAAAAVFVNLVACELLSSLSFVAANVIITLTSVWFVVRKQYMLFVFSSVVLILELDELTKAAQKANHLKALRKRESESSTNRVEI